jgi:hypothetical protein
VAPPGAAARGLGPFEDSDRGPGSLATASKFPGRAGRLPAAGLRPLRAQLAGWGLPRPAEPLSPPPWVYRPSARGAAAYRNSLIQRQCNPTRCHSGRIRTPGGNSGNRVHVYAYLAWVRGCGCAGSAGVVAKAANSRPGLRTVARGGARANSRSAAPSRALADTGKACDWLPAAPMQTS